MSQPLRLAVFDVDGTLVDSQHHIADAMHRVFAQLELPQPSFADVRSIIGLSLEVAMPRLCPELTGAQYHDLIEGYKASFKSSRDAGGPQSSPPLYAGISGLLEGLAKDDYLLLGIATGKSRRGLDRLLGAYELGHMFATQQVADDHPSKPNPSMLEATLRETGANACDAVMIGDTTYDMEMGRAAGMTSIGVSWGYHETDRLLAAGADHIVDDVNDLAALLNDVWKTQDV